MSQSKGLGIGDMRMESNIILGHLRIKWIYSVHGVLNPFLTFICR